MAKSVLDILIAARAIIADRRNWTQGVNARDKCGVEVAASSPTACYFCAQGAIIRASGHNHRAKNEAAEALDEAAQFLFHDLAHIVNDRRTHADVLRIYDNAIMHVQHDLEIEANG